MPKRSNEFQRLIAKITALLDVGALVTEPKMLPELHTGRLREVDIFIEGKVAGQPVAIGIECRDQARKQGVDFVESMKSKHDFLPTDMLILVSSSGFYAPALERARLHNIKAITPTQIPLDLAIDIAAASIRFQTTTTTAQVTSATFSLAWPLEWEGEDLLPSDPDQPLYSADLTPLVTLGAYSNEVMSRHLMEDRLRGPDGARIPPDTEFTVIVDDPQYRDEALHACVVRVDADDADSDPLPRALLPLRRLSVTCKWSVAGRTIAKFTEAGVYDGTKFWAGLGGAAVGGPEMVLVDGPNGMAASVGFSIGAPPSAPQ